MVNWSLGGPGTVANSKGFGMADFIKWLSGSPINQRWMCRDGEPIDLCRSFPIDGRLAYPK